MIWRESRKHEAANIFTEYVVVFGIVSLALVAMNIYIKRGIQGRIKEMSDYFIAPEADHTEAINPTANTDSYTNYQLNGTTNLEAFTGGGRGIIVSDNQIINANTMTVDTDYNSENP
jgi:hypothetical protein